MKDTRIVPDSSQYQLWRDDKHVATVYNHDDARLFNAASDLLSACEDMIGHCRTCNGKGRCYGPVPGRLGSYAPDQPCQDCGDAIAAIAKAKGETR